MRLFLSSYRAGKHNAELLGLLGGIKKVAVVSNAKDYHQPERRSQRMEEVYDFFKSLGIATQEIDLRPFFSHEGIEEELAKHRFIWLAGGNTFLLRRALQYSGAADFLVKHVRDESLTMGGESAGALINGPTLRGSEMEKDSDSPNFVPDGYKPEIIWDGLNLVDYVPVPHFGSEDYGEEMAKYIDYLNQNSIAHKDMTDDQAILIDGDKTEVLR